MSHKRHSVDQIIAKLPRADIDPWQGEKGSEGLQASCCYGTDLLPLAAEVWRHAA